MKRKQIKSGHYDVPLGGNPKYCEAAVTCKDRRCERKGYQRDNSLNACHRDMDGARWAHIQEQAAKRAAQPLFWKGGL